MTDPRRQVVDGFVTEFAREPDFVVRSPGRVNLIGDHTDYNDGFVLPMAIDRHVWLAVRRRNDRQVHAASDGFDRVALDLDALERQDQEWGEYVAGVAWSLSMDGWPLVGWDGFVASDVPVGAGLSSSAALELAVARAFAELSQLPWDPTAMAVASQRAENEWVGMACGIMDQLVVAAADPLSALLIDCRSLATSPVAIPDGAAVLVIDSGTRRSLVDSAYNKRRTSCEEAARRLGVAALRDVDTAAVAAALPEPIGRRARHVVTENQRVLDVVAAFEAGDLVAAGRLMTASHASLRDDYEVSVPEIDTLVELLNEQDGVFGARITGAGFGGCAVALVETDRIADIVERTVPAANEAGLEHVAAYPTQPVAGVSIEGD